MSLVLKQSVRTQDLVATFLSSKSEVTKSAYRIDLNHFQDFLKANTELSSIQELLSISTGELNFIILKYRDFLSQESELSPATVNRRLGAIRSLFKLARMIGITVSKVEISNIKSESYRDTKGPGLPAFKRMLGIALNQTPIKAARDHAILRLLFDLALRASEVVNLDLEHMEFDQSRISIKGKGRSQREYLTLTKTSIDALKKWIEVRGPQPGPLFFNFSRNPNHKSRLSRTGLFKIIRWLGKNADIKTRPHGIRHLSITEACKVAQNNGYALEEVMDHSRHKSVTTLMIYRDRERDAQGAISTLVSNTILEDKNEQ